VVVVDESLPAGLAANATGVLALTLGATVAGLPGPPLIDADGGSHPGLIPQGLTVLRADSATLGALRSRVHRKRWGRRDRPSADGQRTNDYDEFRRRISGIRSADLEYVGVLVYSPRRAVSPADG
jgi:uncharacterized protein DUF2000